MPFSLGPTEMIFIMVVLLLIFGAKRLPELGSGLGKGIREFKRSMTDIKGEIEREEPANQIRPQPPRSAVPPQTAQTAQTASYENETEFNKSS
ncbi:MAG: Sec-independent protein translocase subunit TatA/TatB [Longimicrobiales bacterium]